MQEHIKIGDIAPRVQYIGDGQLSVFFYPFPIFKTSDLKVYLDDAELNSGYSVGGVGEAAGGEVTFDVPPADGSRVTLFRKLAIERTSDFQAGGAFRAKTINDELDRQTAMIQQVAEEAGRSLAVGPTDLAGSITIPAVSERANAFLAFDDSGEPVAATGSTGGVPVSVAMTPVVTAGNLAAARRAMGPWDDALVTADGGDTARALSERFADSANLLDFGAVGDGTTDDTAAITNALAAAAGRTLVVPEGTFTVPLFIATRLTPGANTTIRGHGRSSVLRFDIQTVGELVLFTISNPTVRFENLRIEINNSVTDAQVIGFDWKANNLSFQNVEFDGAVTGPAGSSHQLYVIRSAGSGSQDGLTVSGCEWHDVTRFWLRTNSAASNATRIKVESSHFYNSEATMWALNGVNGFVDNVIFRGNSFKDPFIGSVQGDSYCIGPQATNCTITGNVFRGTGNECIHVEEKAAGLVISGNAISMDLAGRAISVSDNNVGGSAIVPSRIVIADNVIKRTDETNVGNGIELVNDASEREPAHQVTITGNVIHGWNYGIVNGGEQNDRLMISGNIVENCNQGFRTAFGAPGFKDNLLSSCVQGIVTITGGGMFGFNRYYACGTVANASGGEATLNGFEIVFDRTDISGGSTDTFIDLLPLGTNERCFGWLTAHIRANDANEDKHMAILHWDGTTFTNDDKILSPGGGIFISFIQDNGRLKVKVFNANNTFFDSQVWCHFKGAYVLA